MSICRNDRRFFCWTVGLVLFLVCISLPMKVLAKDITFAVIGPHEYDLPVDYTESFDAIVQYGFWNNDKKSFDDNGDTVDGPGTDTWVGLTKYVRFFKLDALPKVGLAYEIIWPEVAVHGEGTGVSGFGDPLTGYIFWVKPTGDPNLTMGLQSFVQIPIGDDELSNHSWNNFTSFHWDWNFGPQNKINFDGDFGAIFRGDREKNGVTVEQGTTVHTNIRLGYDVNKTFTPFLSFDWETKGGDKNKDTGVKTERSDETCLGAGLMVNISPTMSITARYGKAIDGKNVVKSDGVYFKFLYIW